MARRELVLDDLDGVVAEVGRLHEGGYAKGGSWDLAQICEHTGHFIRGSLEGFTDKVPWFIRILGRLMLGKILREGSFAKRVKIPEKLVPRPGRDEAEAVGEFKELVGRLKTQPELHASPVFGRLSREQWLKLHVIHCRHHLSFLLPR